ncbi:alpha/beta fold hydrolase [Oerskovia flava]|uniref:alpha/beta fold hydrolase n=1 Tax=Oerskovia flava TaxID=2986422 RepID=UPI00223F34B1|nr:alpha/beta hydrolase [Oerskovia sp. JB1-3-2]
MSRSTSLSRLARPEGRLAYQVIGDPGAPLVVAVPGMGDLRSTYDRLATALADAGFRVATVDLRGHGDSDTTFRTHGDDTTGHDLLALVEHLGGGPAVLLGTSMGASAAAWAAAERPDLVRGLVLFSPFLREPVASPLRRAALRAVYRLLFARPWGAAAWSAYYRSLHKGRTTDGLAAHAAAVRANLREPDRLRSLRHLALALDHSVVTERLGEVHATALAVVGALDPDWPDPAAELAWIEDTLGARALLVPETGHYPYAQAPDAVVPAVLGFLRDVPAASRG